MLIHRGGAGGVDHRHVVKNQLKIVSKKACDRGGGAHAENIDALCLADFVHGAVEISVRGFFDGAADLFDILHQHAVEHVAVADPSGGHLDALHTGELAAYHLLHCLLQLGIAVVAQLCGKAHHGALGHADRLAELGSGHKCRLVVMLLNVEGNALLTL